MTTQSLSPKGYVRKRIALVDHQAGKIIPYQSAYQTFVNWSAVSDEHLLKDIKDEASIKSSARFVQGIVASGCTSLASAVYVAQWGDAEVCKVGVSCNPAVRLATHQVSNWNEVNYRGLLWVYDTKFRDVEACVLQAAQEMGCRIRGEWLSIHPDEACELVVKAARKVACKAGGSRALLHTVGRA